MSSSAVNSVPAGPAGYQERLGIVKDDPSFYNTLRTHFTAAIAQYPGDIDQALSKRVRVLVENEPIWGCALAQLILDVKCRDQTFVQVALTRTSVGDDDSAYRTLEFCSGDLDKSAALMVMIALHVQSNACERASECAERIPNLFLQKEAHKGITAFFDGRLERAVALHTRSPEKAIALAKSLDLFRRHRFCELTGASKKKLISQAKS